MAEGLGDSLSQLSLDNEAEVNTVTDTDTANDNETESTGIDQAHSLHSNDNGGEGDQSDLESDEGEGRSATEDTEDKELELRKAKEEKLSEEQKEELRLEADQLKQSANSKYRQQGYTEAVKEYTQALDICPLSFLKERAVLYSNRAAAYIYLEETESVIKDCTRSLDLHPHYPKPLLRRAQAYEKTDKLDEALEDYKRLLELDSRNSEAILACQRLPAKIEERNEKLKTEMLGKLKDLGNLVLRPFGLSTNNFQFQQNESGGYSVNFKPAGQ